MAVNRMVYAIGLEADLAYRSFTFEEDDGEEYETVLSSC